MPYSKQTFAYTTGARTFTLALASGYDYESNITVYVEGELTGGGDQIFRDFTFDSEFVINVTDALDNPSSVVVLRTVSPTVFSVDFEAGADVTKRNLQLAFRQQFFLMQELLDGRVDGLDITQLATDAETAASSADSDATSATASAAAAAASAASIDTDDLVRTDGTKPFTSTQTGVAPTSDLHLSTKKYVDDTVGGGGSMLLDGTAQMTAAMLLVDADPTLDEHATRKQYVDDADVLKANLAGPTFTGNVVVPDQSQGNNSTKAANTKYVDAEVAASGADAFSNALLHVQDQKGTGTEGGTFSSGAERIRDLNTVLKNEIGASVGSNQITLLDGDYFIIARAPAYSVLGHRAQLYNVSAASVALKGSSEHVDGSDPSTTHSFVTGRFTATGTDVFTIRHECTSTNSSTGFGRAVGFTGNEVYTDVLIWKVA